MTEEIVRLRVGVTGDKDALASLQKLDGLARALNQTVVNIKIDPSGLAQISSEMKAAIALANKNLAAQARLLEAQNRQTTLAQKAQHAAATQAKAQAQVAREAERTKQQIERTAQAQAKAAQQAERTRQAQEKTRQTTEKTAQAQARVQTETQKTAQAQEKTKQAAEKTRQEVERTAQAQARTQSEAQRTAQTQARVTVEEQRAAAAQERRLAASERRQNQQLQQAQNTFGGFLMQSAKWQLLNTLVNAPAAALRDALDELRQVDSALVNIQKVTGMTAAEMESLADKAFSVGSALGVGASEYLTSTVKWAQAGYGALADDLAELSVMTQKVGDVEEATANQFLLAVDAAYKYQGSIDALKRVLDGANEISNNYATSVEKLASGMGLVSSLAAQAGLEVAETTAAIGTITAITQESGSSAARALRALILNIQGESEIAIDEATGERWSEDQIRNTAAALEELRIQTREYRDGVLALRNPMEVIGEISEKYRQGLISEAELQTLVSDLGGKTRSNQLQALISNFDLYEDMVQTFSGAAGSADRELEYYLSSWEAKANRVRNSWVQLIENLQATDLAKGLLDVVNLLLTLANTDIGQSVVQTAALTAGVLGLTAACKALGGAMAALSLTPVGAAVAAAAAAAAAIGHTIDQVIVTAAESRDAALTAADEFQTAAQEVTALGTQIDETNAKIAELEAKGKLSLTEQQDLSRLREQNRMLAAQLAIQENLKRTAQENLTQTTKAALAAGYSRKMTELMGGIGFFDIARGGSTAYAGAGWAEQITYVTTVLASMREERDRLVQQGSRNPFETWKLKDLAEDIPYLQQMLTDMANELNTYYDNLEGAAGEDAQAAREQILSWLDLLADATDPLGAAIDKIEDALHELDSPTLENFQAALTQLGEDGAVTADEIVQLAQTFPFLASLMDAGGVSAQQLADYFLQAGEAAHVMGEDIDRLTALVHPFEAFSQAAQQALAAYQEAVGQTDFDDVYDGFGSAIQAFFDDYAQGIRNSRQLWATAELFFTPDQLEAMGYDMDAIAGKLEQLQTLFTGDPNDFYDQLTHMAQAGQLISDTGEALATLSQDGGLQIPVEQFDELAEKLGISEQAFTSLLNYLGMFYENIVDIDLSGLEAYIQEMGLAVSVSEQQVINADALNEQLQKTGANGKTIADAFAQLESQGYVLVSLQDDLNALRDAMLQAGIAAKDGAEFQISIPRYTEFMAQLGYSREEAGKLLETLHQAGNVSFVNAEGQALDLQQALAEINTSGMEEAAAIAQDAAGKLDGFTHAIQDAERAGENASFSGLNHRLDTVSDKADQAEQAMRRVQTAIRNLSTLTPIFGLGITGRKPVEADASGTDYARGGPTLLGDEPGGTPKPELVIEDGRAFLAGQAGPEIVSLKPGARVLKHADTVKALNGQILPEAIPALASGTGAIFDGAPQYRPNSDPDQNVPSTSKLPSARPSQTSAAQRKTDWEAQIEALDDYLDAMQTATAVIERTEVRSYEKRIANFRAMQEEVHAVAEAFRRRGLSDTAEEIQQLKTKWLDLADDIRDVYQSMYEDVMDMHHDDAWQLELFTYNREQADRTVAEIVQDNNTIVAQYRQMQQEVHQLAEYYRAQGYDENSDFIQDLQQAWLDYQREIESVYETLTDALDAYLDTSTAKLNALERAGASAGEKIAVYLERIARAQQTLAALQQSNWGGQQNGAISDIQDQIWDDQDAIGDIQNALWDELESAISHRFDLKQDEIDDLQDKIDEINGIIDDYNKELDRLVTPINKTLDALNEQLEAEREHLEALTSPLRDQIEGYYQRQEDGSLEYVEGIDDKLDRLQDELEKETDRYNEEKKQREAELTLARKQLAVQEAIKNLEQAQIDLATARKERTLYTLKDGVWAWRPDEEAIRDAEQAVEDAEQAKQDAENDLKEYEEDRKHQQILDALQDQIDALEKEKKLINKQIDLYQKESEARQKYIQQQIDHWEAEKEAHEDYYADLKSQYEDEIELLQEHKQQLQEQLEDWRDTWADIQQGLEEPARDIEDILNDIARYGTPAMKDQIDRVVDLLRELGDNLADFDPDFGGDDGWDSDDAGGDSPESIRQQMMENSAHWLVADSGERKQIEREQQQLGAMLGATYDDRTGYWYDADGDLLYSEDDPYIRRYIIRMMQQNSDAWLQASGAEKQHYEALNQTLGAYIGAEYDDRTGYWYDRDGSRLYDSGGVAYGTGILQKGVDAPEIVLPPALSDPVLDPTYSREFYQFTQSLDLLFGAARASQALHFTPAQHVQHQSDRHDIHINGVTIGESMLQRPLSDTLSLLAIHVND